MNFDGELRADTRAARREAAAHAASRPTQPITCRMDRHTGGAQTRAERRAHRQARRAVLRRRILTATGAFAAVAVTAGIAFAVHLNGNIERVDIAHGSAVRPDDFDGDLNILVIGSDTRAGLGTTEYGVGTAEGGARSDTNLLVHIAADRQSAQVVSIPRDSMTKAPADCSDPASTVADGVIRRWNDNFNKGGPACAVKTLEGLTGIFIDHVAVIDFSGFQSMVDGLGGVDVCLPRPVSDKDAQIELPAGRQRLDGKDALGYVRMRKSLGDGSDIQRIQRQQTFMSSMAQEATRTSLLLRPDRLYRFLDAATKSMTADDDLGLTRLMSLASSLKGLGTDDLVFVTVPTEQYPADHNRVQWREDAADALWAAIRDDVPLPGHDNEVAPQRDLTVPPSDIAVSVVNESGATGLARQETAALQAQGFVATMVDTAPPAPATGVTIRHAKGDTESARTLAAAYRGAKLKVDPQLTAGSVELVLGEGAPTAGEVPNREGTTPIPTPTVTAPPAPTEVATRSASEDICG